MPKISANKLGEFLVTASPKRRLRILNDQKYPSDVVIPLYRMAHAPLTAYFESGGLQPEAITSAIDHLRSDESGSKWVLQDRRNTADALERILLLTRSLPLERPTYQYLRAPGNPPKLSFSGVEVSVRPDLLLRVSKRGRQYSGAIKFHFMKTAENSLGEDGGRYIASLLHRWSQENSAEGFEPRPEFCLSVDVFRSSVVPAPRAFSRRLSEIEAACQEIASRWNLL